MPEFLPFRAQIAGALLFRRRNDRHLVDDGQVVAIVNECVGLLRIVRQKTNLLQSQVLENLNADPVVAHVGAVTERMVGLDGVEPAFLQSVGLELGEQADSPAFLWQASRIRAIAIWS